MRALPALVTVAAIVVPLASGACYSVPALEQPDGGHGSSSGSDADAGRDVFEPSVDSSGGSSSGGSSGGHVDASGGPDAACTGILCPCMNASECTTDAPVCGTTAALGQAIFTAANNGSTGFCTKPCCTSTNCPSGTVCWASGEGGQYCVDPTWVGRSKPAAASTLIGGSSCSTGSQCNSGLCANGTCADTCCSYADSATECASPDATCAFGAFPGMQGIDSHFAPHCAPLPGNTQTGNPCSQNSDCQGGLCYDFGGSLGSECTQPCRTSQGCVSDSVCGWDIQGNDVYAACFPLEGQQGGYGASCGGNNDCASLVCNMSTCTAPCFADSDCNGVSGWSCTQDIVYTFSQQGSYSLLSCGP